MLKSGILYLNDHFLRETLKKPANIILKRRKIF